MTALDELLAEADWLGDENGSYSQDAYRKMPGTIRRLVAVVNEQQRGLEAALAPFNLREIIGHEEGCWCDKCVLWATGQRVQKLASGEAEGG